MFKIPHTTKPINFLINRLSAHTLLRKNGGTLSLKQNRSKENLTYASLSFDLCFILSTILFFPEQFFYDCFLIDDLLVFFL